MFKELCFVTILLLSQVAFAQKSPKAWLGKKAAVVLTYDDAIDQHLDHALPVLDSLGLKATFYLTAFSPSMQQRLPEWKQLIKKGHELGNHTLYHPCIGGAGREWVKPEYDLKAYSEKRIVDEIRMTNLFLKALDGKKQRTFAYTCGDMTAADGKSFVSAISNDFVAARAVRNEMHQIKAIDLMNVDCYMVNNHSFEQMKSWVDQAIESNSLLVFLFHGVGGGNSLDVSIANHRKILKYIKSKEKQLLVAPMVDVALHIKDWQQKNR